jgi:hypothetical protein
MTFKVDVQPLAACRAGALHGDSHEPRPDSAAAERVSHESIDQEGVGTPVPGDVDEGHKLVVFSRTDPAQAVPAHPGLPVIIQEPVTEAFGMQGVQLGVSELATPRVIDH